MNVPYRDDLLAPVVLSAASERRFRLTAFVQDATRSTTFLYSRKPLAKEIIANLKSVVADLMLLCSKGGEAGEDRKGITAAANRVKELASDLSAAEPIMGNYYTGPLQTSMGHLLTELQAK